MTTITLPDGSTSARLPSCATSPSHLAARAAGAAFRSALAIAILAAVLLWASGR